jgi:GWxTD domain-containing protein
MKRPTVLAAICLLFFAALSAAASVPELYQKMKSEFARGQYSNALHTIETLDREKERPENQTFREQLGPALAFYRGAILASLGRPAEARTAFVAYISLEPNASVDPSLYSKKVVAAFEDARRGTRRGTGGTRSLGGLAEAYSRFRMTGPPEADESWADGPVRYLMSPEERNTFSSLSDPAARAEYVENFWKAHDPRPETPENELRTEFERRVAFADQTFRDGERRGSLTDRGMVFVLLGPPTYAGKKPLLTEDANQPLDNGNGLLTSRLNQNNPGARPSNNGSLTGEQNWREIWHYRRDRLPAGVPYQQVDFEFLTKRGYGVNVLQREVSATTTIEAAVRRAQTKS